ncbi:hypothetical protein VDGD_20152 [Verticillium dahliae]|nr:hypothetical protein VDGD_20152 [Verticillium dahliae]
MLMTFHDFWHLDIPLNRRYNPCKPGVIAYALPSQSFMVNSDTFFNQMPPTSSRCHAQDQQRTICMR